MVSAWNKRVTNVKKIVFDRKTTCSAQFAGDLRDVKSNMMTCLFVLFVCFDSIFLNVLLFVFCI